MKKCTKCLNFKDIKEFSKHSGCKDGLQPGCKACAKAYRRSWYEANKERVQSVNKTWVKNNPNHGKEWYQANKDVARNYQLKRDFGITLDEYNKMLANQNNKCKICLLDSSQFNKVFAVDHCHSTLKIRGLLCGPCNAAIGLLKDDVKLLQNAIVYLEKNHE